MIRAVELCDRAEDGKVCGGLRGRMVEEARKGGLRRMRGGDLCRWLSANDSHDHRFPFVPFLISFRMAVDCKRHRLYPCRSARLRSCGVLCFCGRALEEEVEEEEVQ